MAWIRKDTIDSLTWREIKRHIKNPTLLKPIMKTSRQTDQSRLPSLRRELIRIRNEIERTGLERQNIIRLHRKRRITEDDFTLQVDEITNERAFLNQQKKEIELRIQGETHFKERLNMLEQFVRQFRDSIDNLAFEAKREIVDLIVDRVVIKEDIGIELQIVIPDFPQNAAPLPNDTDLQLDTKFYGDAGVIINSPFVKDLKIRIYSKVDIR